MTDEERRRWQNAVARLCTIADITADELLEAGFRFIITDGEEEQ